MRFSAIISLICVLSMYATPAQAQIKVLPRETLEAVNSPRLSPDSSSVEFDVRLIQAGKINEDDEPKTFKVEMTNTGNQPIKVLRLQTTCSCLSANLGQTTLNKGEKTQLTVRYNPKGHWGKFEHKVFVYTQPGNAPAAVLKFSVEVTSSADKSGLYQVRMGSIGLRTADVTFVKGSRATETLNFINLGDKPLKLECEEMFLPDYLKFEVLPETVEPGAEAKMVIIYEPTAQQPRNEVPLILKGLGTTPAKSTIKIRFE